MIFDEKIKFLPTNQINKRKIIQLNEKEKFSRRKSLW